MKKQLPGVDENTTLNEENDGENSDDENVYQSSDDENENQTSGDETNDGNSDFSNESENRQDEDTDMHYKHLEYEVDVMMEEIFGVDEDDFTYNI